MSQIGNQEYKRLSKRAKLLLSLQEGLDVDFKRNLSGLEPTDLVAFANSKKGGAILVGIDEIIGNDGRQTTKIVGCSVGDAKKRAIIDKANSCIPKLEVSIFIENLSQKPFFRIEIKSGDNKPYCTKKGIYSIRDNGRISPIYPDKLLSMFIEREGETFLRRFKNAAQNIEKTISKVRKEIEEGGRALLGEVEETGSKIDESLNKIFNSAENAESLSDEAMNLSDETLDEVQELSAIVESVQYTLRNINEKMEALLEKFNIEDPRMKELGKIICTLIKEWMKLGRNKEEAITDINKIFPDVKKDQLKIWCKNKLKEEQQEE